MSTANTQPSESYDCEQCGTPTPATGMVAGSFCSTPCRHRHRGQKLLNAIQSDHRYCYTCYRKLKTVEKAHPRMPECVIGFQYRTEHARTGQITTRIDEYTEFVRVGTICRCGQTDHSAQESIIQNTEFREVVGNLYYALESLRVEGVHDHELDITRLAGSLRDQVDRDGWDFALAVGHAIQTGES